MKLWLQIHQDVRYMTHFDLVIKVFHWDTYLRIPPWLEWKLCLADILHLTTLHASKSQPLKGDILTISPPFSILAHIPKGSILYSPACQHFDTCPLTYSNKSTCLLLMFLRFWFPERWSKDCIPQTSEFVQLQRKIGNCSWQAYLTHPPCSPHTSIPLMF